MNIFIVEDNFLIAEDLSSMSQNLGHNVIGMAGNGHDALTQIVEQKPDLVLMDIKMEGIDGLETTRRVQQHYMVPVIIISAYTDNNYLQQAIEVGVGAFLTKPVKQSDLQNAIGIAYAHFPAIRAMLTYQKKYSVNQGRQDYSIISICMYCKNVKERAGEWIRFEQFITETINGRFSHGCCPGCIERLRRDLKR